MERDVYVRCRPVDFDIVESVLQEASQEYSDIIKKETNYDMQVSLLIDKKQALKEHQSQ